MDEDNSEREPLIKLNSLHHSYSTTSEGGTNDLNIRSQDAEKTVLSSEKITFTWSEINVFTLEKTRTRLRSFLTRCKNNHPQSQGKQILKNVNGVARPGELLAILGSSGAGKTTLLNTLTSRSSSRLVVTGLRCANGVPVDSNSLTSQLAYVQQDDLFIGSLTVKEHLIFQALVRMDRHIPYRQRIKRVEEVISELGLSDCENTTIGIQGRLKGISGGEMKRLSFASEVLTNPSLMFCDEPTSGLDSFMALNVVQVLKRLAQTGKTVVCTIHQPSSELYAMFDKLLLMAEGRVAFLGSPEEADQFFTTLDAPCPHNYNPADYFIQLLAILPGREESCKQAVNMICDQFARSEIGVQVAVTAATLENPEYKYSDYLLTNGNYRNRYKASWCSQFRAVLWRSWISVIKEPLLIQVRLLQTIVPQYLMVILGAEVNLKLTRWRKLMNSCNVKPDSVFILPAKYALLQYLTQRWRHPASVIEVLLGKWRWDPLRKQEIFYWITALIIGSIYFGQTLNQDGVMNINGALFIFLTNMTFQNVFAVVNVFCAELPILLREHKNGMYRTDVYFLCKTLAETPLFVFIPVIFVCICYYLIGLNPEQPRLFVAMGIVVLVANVAISFGYFVSCLSNTVSMALSIAPPLIIPFLLFGGFFLNVGSIPIYFKWISYASWFRYGNEALMINQWEGIDSINCTDSEFFTCPRDGHIVLEVYNFSENNFTLDLLALGGLICGFRFLAYLALVLKTYTFD